MGEPLAVQSLHLIQLLLFGEGGRVVPRERAMQALPDLDTGLEVPDNFIVGVH